MHSSGPLDLKIRLGYEPANVAQLSIRIEDAGGGKYVVLNAFEWSFDNIEEAEETFEAIRKMLKTVSRE
jgi:hypothetical protein